jgi:hypothetical protein
MHIFLSLGFFLHFFRRNLILVFLKMFILNSLKDLNYQKKVTREKLSCTITGMTVYWHAILFLEKIIGIFLLRTVRICSTFCWMLKAKDNSTFIWNVREINSNLNNCFISFTRSSSIYTCSSLYFRF